MIIKVLITLVLIVVFLMALVSLYKKLSEQKEIEGESEKETVIDVEVEKKE